MSLRLLADENVDHRIVHRLEHYGHDVEHVDFVSELGKGVDDERIVAYSLETDRAILTSDSDFLVAFDASEYGGLLFVEDETLTVSEVADIVDAIDGAIDDADGLFYVSSNWL